MQEFLESRTVTLSNGRKVVLRGIVPGDCPAVSAMVIDNFRHAANFDRLDDVARRAYVQANSIEGVREASTHPDNIACLVAVSEQIARSCVLEQAQNDVLKQRNIESLIA